MIAVLTRDIERALTFLRKECSLWEYSKHNRKGQFTSGREFIIITDAEQLLGLELKDFRVIGAVDGELLEAARQRMR